MPLIANLILSFVIPTGVSNNQNHFHFSVNGFFGYSGDTDPYSGEIDPAKKDDRR
ncbi:MAG: hypothetical protein PHE33_04370 [Bacteroidales bacterium]|nr:hypothetical protein [Bacteroidales bacterium]